MINTIKLNKIWWKDFDYIYKGIYLTRLLSFLLLVYTAITINAYFNNQNIVTAWEATTGVLIFIFIFGKIVYIIRGAK